MLLNRYEIEARDRLLERWKGSRSMLFTEVVAHPSPFSFVAPLRVYTTPALILSGCFAAGILCRHWWQPPLCVVLTCLCLLAVAAVAIMKSARMAWPATACAFIALGWAAALLQPPQQNKLLLPYADGLSRSVEAEVITSRMLAPLSDLNPDKDSAWDEEDTAISAREVLELNTLRVEDVTPETDTMLPIKGNIVVTLSGDHAGRAGPPYLPCGTHLQLTLRMHPETRYLDPGVWNYADQLEARGISVSGTANIATLHVMQDASVPMACRFQRAQHWSSQRITRLAESPWMTRLPRVMRLQPTDAAMLRAMLFGDRTALQRNVRMAFERTGSFHLFVVAGVHIAILMAVLYELFQKLRVPPWGAAFLTLPLVTCYAVFTGFGQPVQRALWMSSVYLFALCLYRDRQTMNALGIAVFAMLIVDPSALFDSGFQMTVLSVFATGGIAVPVVERTFSPCVKALKHIQDVRLDVHFVPYLAALRVSCRVAGRLFTGWRPKRDGISVLQRIPAWVLRGVLFIAEALVATLIAEIVMALPMAIYFHRMTPFAAPANLLALPLIGFVMGCALATFLLALLHPVLALIPAAMTALALHVIGYVVRSLNAFHGADMRVPAPLPAAVVVACVLWLIAVVLVREHRSRPAWAGVLLSLLAFVVVMLPARPFIARDALAFTSIDVGQGDSELMTTPEGRTMVIDAGGPVGSESQSKAASFDVGEAVVSPMLWRQQIRTIDVLAITHAHSDHIGGAMAVLRNFHPRELWISVDAPSLLLRNLLDEAKREGVTIRHMHAGDTVQFGSVKIDVESPFAGYQVRNEPVNDDSLVLRLQYGRASLLAAGDAEQPSEYAMLARDLQPVALLKVGHHGSNTSTTDAFLQRIHPQCAIISCGRNNAFGHPRIQVLQRLQAAQVKTARTDTMGAMQYLLHADGSITAIALMSEH